MRPKNLAVLATVLALSLNAPAWAASMSSCKEAMAKFRDLGNVSERLAEAHGYAVLPTIGKAGIGVGGAGGSGCVFGADATAVALTYGAAAGRSTTSSR